MPITILAPTPATTVPAAQDLSDDEGFYDEEGDVEMAGTFGGAKRARFGRDVVTPGELVTDDPQWMRHGAPNGTVNKASRD
ncbi:MAG: hypothetical protein INR71_03560 [Terriglobus roseus]|nr:hypothetical protein [Terriglobus roseus]